jgi:hypothetical protein
LRQRAPQSAEAALLRRLVAEALLEVLSHFCAHGRPK